MPEEKTTINAGSGRSIDIVTSTAQTGAVEVLFLEGGSTQGEQHFVDQVGDDKILENNIKKIWPKAWGEAIEGAVDQVVVDVNKRLGVAKI